MRLKAPSALGLFAAFTTAACTILSVQVIRLTRENARLNARASEAMEKAGSDSLTVGEVVPPLPARALGDRVSEVLDLRDGRLATVLFALGGACHTCESSLPYFESLAKAGAGGGTIFVAVQIDTMKSEELRASPGTLPIVMVPEPQTTWLRRIPLVPSIIILDGDGGVRRTWFGVLSARQQAELEAELARAQAAWK